MLNKLAWLYLISTPHFLFLNNIGGAFAVLRTCKVIGVHNSHSRVVNQRQESAAVLPFELSSWLDPGLDTTFSTCNSSGDKGKEFEEAAQKRISKDYLSVLNLSIQKIHLGVQFDFCYFHIFMGLTRRAAPRCANLAISVVPLQLLWHFTEHCRCSCVIQKGGAVPRVLNLPWV